MIELRRLPIPGAKPRTENHQGFTFDWREVRHEGKILWAAIVPEDRRETAESWVAAFGEKWKATLAEVAAPSPSAAPPSQGVPVETLQMVYNAVHALGEQGMSRLLQGRGLPVREPEWVNVIPPEIRQGLMDGRGWPGFWAVENGQPTVVREAWTDEVPFAVRGYLFGHSWPDAWDLATLGDEPNVVTPVRVLAPDEAPVKSEPAAPSPKAEPVTPSYPADKVGEAVATIRKLLAESTDEPSAKKIAYRLTQANLPAAGENMAALLQLARETV